MIRRNLCPIVNLWVSCRHISLAREAVLRKADSFFNMQFITSSISTTLVLLLLGMVVFFVLSANNLSTYVRENIGFTILVSDDMKEPEALIFQKALNEKAYVKESAYISKEQALKEQIRAEIVFKTVLFINVFYVSLVIYKT